MGVSVVDTGVLVGMVDADDEHHDVAMEIVRGLDHGDLPTARVTNYVVLETLNWIHQRQQHRTAVETLERLRQSAGFEVVQAPQKDFRRAAELFEEHDRLAFGDATVIAYMRREGIQYLYAFDDDFDGLDGISRLPTADTPFE